MIATTPQSLLRELATRILTRHRRASALADRDLSLLAWGRLYLPEHFKLSPSRMHLWLEQQLERASHERGLKLNVIGPRGGAKSTLGTLAFVLRAAVEGREPYIWIVSDTKLQANSHLENVRSELTGNARLARDYSGAVGKGPAWTAAAITLRNRVTIEALGTGQRIRGRRRNAHRPSLIVCDDLQNDGHMNSARQRASSLEWFQGTLLKAGNTRTNILNLATALHRDALAMQLQRTPGWTSGLFRAIEVWPRNMQLWSQWEEIYCDPDEAGREQAARRFYIEHRTAMDEGAVLLWPAEEDLYTLMCMRAESGRTAFEREKQGSPLDPERCEWPEEYFGEHVWFTDWPRVLQVKVIALDPSKGGDARRGDYSAFVLLGIDAHGMLYIDADLQRRPTPQIVADGVELCRTFRPQALVIEGNQFQELLGGEFTAELARQGLAGVAPWAIDNRVNKLVRIRRLGPLLATKRLRFKANSPGAKLLVDQLKDFPLGDHDDGPDAAEMAIRLAIEILSGGTAGDDLPDRIPI